MKINIAARSLLRKSFTNFHRKAKEPKITRTKPLEDSNSSPARPLIIAYFKHKRTLAATIPSPLLT